MTKRVPRNAGLNRRAFVQAATALTAASGTGLVTGCATGGGGGGGGDGDNGEGELSGAVDEPLDIVIFDGGFGDEYAREHQQLYAERHYDGNEDEVEHTATQEISQQLQPRFTGGNPPDVVDNSGAQEMDLATLVNEGQITALEPLLEQDSLDIEGQTIADTLVDGALEAVTYDGEVMAIPYAINIDGLWYDAALFEDNGWEFPSTWDELMQLGEQTRDAGIPLWTYQGQYPQYMRSVFDQMVQKRGGLEVLRNIDNLEDGAWQQDAVREVLEALYELKQRDLIMPGTASLDHIQAQAAWIRHEAAVIPCGSWLESEMKSQLTDDFDLTISPTPSLGDDDAIPYEAIPYNPGENFIVPAQANNQAGGLEYLRVMLSREGARTFAELTFTLTILDGVHEDQDLGTGLESSLEAMQAAQEVTRLDSALYHTWYQPLSDETEAAFGQMISGDLDVDGFIERIQQRADDVKNNDDITKQER